MVRLIVITDGYSPEVRILAERILVVEELDDDQFRWVIDVAVEDEPALWEADSIAHIERSESPANRVLGRI